MITKERYVTRLRAMITMSTASPSEGERTSALERITEQLSKYKDYGFGSPEEVQAEILETGEEQFLPEDFVQYSLKFDSLRVPRWERVLYQGCAYQQQCQFVNGHRGAFYLFGPKSRVENTIWLFQQLKSDILRSSEMAWVNLKSKTGEHKKSFRVSYALAVATSFSLLEKSRRGARMTATPEEGQAGLIRVSDCLDIHSEVFAKSQLNFSARPVSAVSSSAAGRNAAAQNAHEITNRRLTPNLKGLPGSY